MNATKAEKTTSTTVLTCQAPNSIFGGASQVGDAGSDAPSYTWRTPSLRMALPTITSSNMNQNLKKMEFPWPSPVVSIGNQMVLQEEQGKKFPFGNVIHCHAGDPQGYGQKPITFFRQVSAICLNPEIAETGNFPADVVSRAQYILNNCLGNTIGAYTESRGNEAIRRQVASYISERDEVESSHEDIFLCSGATDGVRMVMNVLNYSISGKPPGIMVPIPQYPLFSTTVVEYGMHQIDYYLDEDNEWALDVQELERALEEAKPLCEPRALVIINPGNPSGFVMSKKQIEDIVQFAYKESLFLIVDEVYQYNVYEEGMEFVSFRKVTAQMGSPYNQIELATFMSGSKGYMGECGARSGYCEITNLDDEVKSMLWKVLTLGMCPTLVGQMIMYCITNPPKPGEPSYQTFMQEKNDVLESLKQRAQFVYESFNGMEGVKCNKIVGAMYAYPRLLLPEKAIREAKALNQPPDEFYARKLVESQGICVIPGCLFGQRPGTYHYRMTFLPQMDKLKEILRRIKQFHTQFMEEYK